MTDEFEALEEAARKATRGPWSSGIVTEADMDFIAAADPQTALRLIEECRRYRELHALETGRVVKAEGEAFQNGYDKVQAEARAERMASLARIYMTRYEQATGLDSDSGDWDLVLGHD